MAIFSNLFNYRNTGLLLLRIGLGVMFIFHGYPKLLGGPEKWAMIGGAAKHIGIDFMPVFWGFMAAVAETFGGFLLIIGLAFRPICILLIANLIVAASMHLGQEQGLSGASHAIELAIVFTGLLFVGPGKYSMDKK
ncbi:MAG: DoxX family protein [Sphingobacteriaceae bacterium]